MQRPPWTIETVGLPLLVRSSGMLPSKCYWKLSKREDFHLLEAQCVHMKSRLCGPLEYFPIILHGYDRGEMSLYG